MKKTDNEIQFIKSAKRKFAEFISKNSVYGIFAVVLVAVCAITLFALPHSNNKPTETQTPQGIVDVDPSLRPTPPITNQATITPPQATITPTPPAHTPGNTPYSPPTETVVPPSDTTPTPPAHDVNSGNNTKFKLALPFDKKAIITSYSNETPIYSETLHEWACHVGIDFACNKDDEVKAAADGIVVSITTDDLYGTSILVSHTEGFFTLYRGLQSANVTNDELIAEGQIIGTAAESVPFEAHMASHIHFELIKDKLSVNPLSFAK